MTNTTRPRAFERAFSAFLPPSSKHNRTAQLERLPPFIIALWLNCTRKSIYRPFGMSNGTRCLYIKTNNESILIDMESMSWNNHPIPIGNARAKSKIIAAQHKTMVGAQCTKQNTPHIHWNRLNYFGLFQMVFTNILRCFGELWLINSYGIVSLPLCCYENAFYVVGIGLFVFV